LQIRRWRRSSLVRVSTNLKREEEIAYEITVVFISVCIASVFIEGEWIGDAMKYAVDYLS
jgi:hypothetical protein